jgi:hypothetical protein
MNSSFIKVNAEFIRTNEIGLISNFWELNSQLSLIKPFSILYESDKSKNKVDSSKLMWAFYFNNYPDEEENIYYRIPKDQREPMLEEVFTLPKPLIEYTTEQEEFRKICLTSTQKDLLLEKEALHERAIFLRDTKYTLDSYEIVTIGSRAQRVVLPGTAKQLDQMKKATDAIMKNFERIEEKYLAEKRGEARIFGGRKESATEKNLI